MRITTPGLRSSDRIISRITADILNIPETDEELQKIASLNKEAKSCDCPPDCDCKCECHGKKEAATACPQCGADMRRTGAMERCACGYAKATAHTKTSKRVKRAADTSVADYYKKIFPDDYVADMTAEGEVTPDAPGKVEYGSVPVDKKVSRKVTVRELLAASEEAGNCEVKDGHPESGVNEGSGAEETPDPKWQSPPSANSVTGPEKVKQHGPGEKSPGEVSAPDLGLPRGARRKTAIGASCPKCGGTLDQSGQCPTCGTQNAIGTEEAGSVWIDRATMAKMCTPCAEEMKRLGIRKVRASVVAEAIANKAKTVGITGGKR